MVSKDQIIKRRALLRQSLKSGVVVLLGNRDVPFNYPANPYDFRQDSNFLYFLGINRAGFSAILDIDNDREVLFGNDPGIDDVIWSGAQKTIKETAFDAGIEKTAPYRDLVLTLHDCLAHKREVHFLPFYREAGRREMAELLKVDAAAVNEQASLSCIKTVIALRSLKDDSEIAEITEAIDIAREMHLAVMKTARAGLKEQKIAGMIRGIALSRGSAVSFPPILSMDGEILHNHSYDNILENGRLLLTDAGAENNAHYNSDISRTVPVGGKFSTRQREIYEIVLKANKTAISQIKPGACFRDIHLDCARTITGGLKDLGMMKGDVNDAVAEGAHALFFPHGLGHMMGLEAHDMESLGEDLVGYDGNIKRSDQFGLAYLRLGKKLEARFVVTVEPGIYFIPLLIEQWKKDPKWSRFINFNKVETYTDFGGIRIEDNIVVTDSSQLNVSGSIPKSVEEIESVMSRG